MPQPGKIPLAFAASGDKNIIPESTETTGLASWRDGFPAITSTPFSEGGVAPKRADFNGIFNALSLAILWQQQGGFYEYDATIDYEVGNVVEYNGDLYKCIAANGPSSAIKAPTDTTVWDAIATASGYLPLSGGTLSNGTNSLELNPGKIELSASLPFIDFHHDNSTVDHTARIINDQDGRLVVSVQNDLNTQNMALVLFVNGSLQWDGKEVVRSESATAGKMKLSDGTMVQWGKKASSNTQVQSVVFPEAFIDNNFELSAQFLSGSLSSVNTDARSVLTGNLSVTGFNFVALGITSNTVTPVVGNVSWIAVGRWKA